MAKKAKAKAQAVPLQQADDEPAQRIKRNANGTWAKGYSGFVGADGARARRLLNLDTLKTMHEAFQDGGRAAIYKVMRTQPAIFLKMLVLLVPRELEVTHSQGTKGMSDEQLEAAVQAIEGFLAKRAAGPGADARVIEAQPVAEDASATKD